MDQESIFKAIQKFVTNTPLILVGSGASAPHGLPSMYTLGHHLIDQLGDKYPRDFRLWRDKRYSWYHPTGRFGPQ